ncbi:MAG: hypothetical protein O9302_00330 [Cyclobacteriaceae bacterium]|jgi:hypothetical protein|nr:hypothetical protein [Cytophagales bacterium]MCZ8326477.1 hypothetical protein [Cyclobacteriaceae bacterium]
MAETKNNSVLPTELAKQYDVLEGTTKEFYHPAIGKVDLSKIDGTVAEQLKQLGILIKKEK